MQSITAPADPNTTIYGKRPGNGYVGRADGTERWMTITDLDPESLDCDNKPRTITLWAGWSITDQISVNGLHADQIMQAITASAYSNDMIREGN